MSYSEFGQKISRMMQGEILTIKTAYSTDLPDEAVLQTHGIDSISMSEACSVPDMFFTERIMGMKIRHVDGLQDTFHSFPEPCVFSTEDIRRLNREPQKSSVWKSYMRRIACRKDTLPLSLFAYSPLDAACNLAGAERIYLSLAQEDGFAETLLDAIEAVTCKMAEEFIRCFGVPYTPQGFPGIYISDLATINLSGSMLINRIYPYYQRIAMQCGGAVLSVCSPDEASFRTLCHMKQVHALTVDSRIPLTLIDRYLGEKTLILQDYERIPEVEGPALLDGMYVNPIVCCHGDDSVEIWKNLGKKHSMILHVERRFFLDVQKRMGEFV